MSNEATEYKSGLPGSLTTGLGISAVVFSVLCMCRIGYDRSRLSRQAMPVPAITEDVLRSVNLETIKQVLDQWLVTTRVTDCQPLDPSDTAKNASEGTESNDSISSSLEQEATDDEEMPGITCHICLDQLNAGNLVSWSKQNSQCTHTFHKDCIMEWLLRHDDCPCCRQAIVTEGFDRIMATSNAESRGDNVSEGKDVEAGSSNDEVGTHVFCDIHGRTCENDIGTANEMVPSSGDIDEQV
mmetsp:Transcript_11013/g.20115  ORF Transcript_11013/g.20115 Transcript_11013/m.20115 type:complete len:241 (-) Transcript_11013:89-811(-)